MWRGLALLSIHSGVLIITVSVVLAPLWGSRVPFPWLLECAVSSVCKPQSRRLGVCFRWAGLNGVERIGLNTHGAALSLEGDSALLAEDHSVLRALCA